MKPLDLNEVQKYVSENIVSFHEARLQALSKLNLKKVLRKKNPYLFKAKHIVKASELVNGILEATLSSSEEKCFGNFLEDLAIFISSKTCGGEKSSATGIDLEFNHENIYYIVSIKSGPNWGNSSQQSKVAEDLTKAMNVKKQSNRRINVQPVLGICYGKTRTSHLRGYMKVVGQNFWYLISENENLYKDIIEPLGYKAKEFNDAFRRKRDILENRFTQELLSDFCINHEIDWEKIIEFNSGNLDLTS
jgi:hypothetical protein